MLNFIDFVSCLTVDYIATVIVNCSCHKYTVVNVIENYFPYLANRALGEVKINFLSNPSVL